MIVDDIVDAGETLAALLEAQGHRVTVQAHARGAITVACQGPPQVFLLGIGLPDMNGHELAKRLRAKPRMAKAQFIALTGYGQVHHKVLSAAAGFYVHCAKPADIAMPNKVLLEANTGRNEFERSPYLADSGGGNFPM